MLSPLASVGFVVRMLLPLVRRRENQTYVDVEGSGSGSLSDRAPLDASVINVRSRRSRGSSAKGRLFSMDTDGELPFLFFLIFLFLFLVPLKNVLSKERRVSSPR